MKTDIEKLSKRRTPPISGEFFLHQRCRLIGENTVTLKKNMYYLKKQPPEVFCKKRCSYKFCKISQQNTCARVSFFSNKQNTIEPSESRQDKNKQAKQDGKVIGKPYQPRNFNFPERTVGMVTRVFKGVLFEQYPVQN